MRALRINAQPKEFIMKLALSRVMGMLTLSMISVPLIACAVASDPEPTEEDGTAELALSGTATSSPTPTVAPTSSGPTCHYKSYSCAASCNYTCPADFSSQFPYSISYPGMKSGTTDCSGGSCATACASLACPSIAPSPISGVPCSFSSQVPKPATVTSCVIH